MQEIDRTSRVQMLSFQISLGSQGILETWVTLYELYGAFVLSFQSQKCFVDGTMKLHLTLHQREVEEMMTEFTFLGGNCSFTKML